MPRAKGLVPGLGFMKANIYLAWLRDVTLHFQGKPWHFISGLFEACPLQNKDKKGERMAETQRLPGQAWVGVDDLVPDHCDKADSSGRSYRHLLVSSCIWNLGS